MTNSQPKPFRVDNAEKGLHGWSIQLSRFKLTIKLYFSDDVFGGRDSAHAAAVAASAELLRICSCSALESRALERRFNLRKNYRSGMPGVTRVVIADRAYWVARWTEASGRRFTRRFSITTHGEAAARQLAMRTRAEAMKDLQERYDELRRRAVSSFIAECGRFRATGASL